MKLVPYLNFNGNCKEALNYYADILGGEITFTQLYSDMPPQDGVEVSEEYKDKILHAQIKFNNNELYFSDVMPQTSVSAGSNISITITCDSDEELERIYKNFFGTSNITMPLADMFWGAKFASLIDKYGFYWSLDYSNQE